MITSKHPAGRAAISVRTAALAWLATSTLACSATNGERPTAPAVLSIARAETQHVEPAPRRADAPARIGVLSTDDAALASWIEEHNAGIAAARARVLESAADLDSAELLPNPGFEFDWGGIDVGARNPTDLPSSDSQSFQFGVHELVELGKRGPRRDAARLRLDAERARYRSSLGQAIADARAALAKSVYLRSRLALLEDSLAAAKQLLDVEAARRAQGDVSDNDYDRLSLDTTLLELDVPRGRSDLEAARAELCTLLGTNQLEEADGAEPLASLAKIPVPAADLEDALLHRADLAADADEIDAAGKDELLARRRALPDPTIGIQYLHDRLTVAGNQPDTLALTVGIDLPFFDRGQHDAERARQRAIELSNERAETLREAHADAVSLFERQESLAAILARLEADALPKAAQVLDATRAAFDRGELSLTDVLLARRTHTDLVLKHMDLQFESFSVRNELRRVLGLDARTAEEARAEVKP